MKGHLLISGLGGNMGKSLLKDLLIQGLSSSFILDQVSFLFTIYLNSWFNSFFPLKITVDHTSFLMLLYQLTFWSWKVNSPPWIHWILCKCSKRLPSSVTVISPWLFSLYKTRVLISCHWFSCLAGAITGAVHQRAVQPRNKWRDAGQMLQYSSLLTPQITTIQVRISTNPAWTNSQKIPKPLRLIM